MWVEFSVSYYLTQWLEFGVFILLFIEYTWEREKVCVCVCVCVYVCVYVCVCVGLQNFEKEIT